MAARHKPPLALGWPLIGSLFPLLRDPAGFLAANYLRLGPIFRVRALHRRLTVLAGPEANLFLTRGGIRHLGSRGTLRRLAAEVGADNLVVATDGAQHQHLRRLLRPGYSREVADRNLPRLAAAVEALVRALPAGRPIVLRPLMQRLVVEQLTLAMLGRGTQAVFEDAAAFAAILIGTTAGPFPPWRLRGRRYRAAKAAMWALARDILAERRGPDRKADPAREADLADIIVTACGVEGRPFAENDLIMGMLGPYLAGMDTASNSAAFLAYELLRQPALRERVVAEADEAFADGVPSAQGLRRMQTLRGAFLETLRLHPVAAGIHRHAVEPFEFNGYRVEAGEEVLAAMTVSHFLPRFFPDPYRFDVERYHEPRHEDRQPGAFAPWGIGPHTCLGMGQAEIVIMLAVAVLLRSARVALDPPGYQLRMRMNPLPGPDDRCRLRVVEHRTAAGRPAAARAEQVAWVLPTLDRRLLTTIASRVAVHTYPAGITVIRQGDVADRFFMILEGEAEVLAESAAGPRTVARLGAGGYFGEVGLLTGSPRTATVRAATELVLMELDRESFLTMVTECDLTSQELARVVHERVVASSLAVALPSLDGRQAALAPQIEQRQYPAGGVIVRQGEPADTFYVLVRGTCEVTCRGPDGQEAVVRELVGGDFFGEVGLLLGVPRTATVRVGPDAEAAVLALGRGAFQRLVTESKLAHEEIARVMRRRLADFPGAAASPS